MPKIGEAYRKGPGDKPLIVFRNIWKALTWAHHGGQRLTFDRLEEAREVARANGYTGIKVRSV